MRLLIKKEVWEKYSKFIFVILFLGVFFLGLFYIYAMNLAVLKTAERNDNLDKLTDIKNEFQSLENIYLDKLEQLNIPYAKSLGFVESEPNDYVRVYRFMAQNSNHAQ